MLHAQYFKYFYRDSLQTWALIPSQCFGMDIIVSNVRICTYRAEGNNTHLPNEVSLAKLK
jgi:hypothetical protein